MCICIHIYSGSLQRLEVKHTFLSTPPLATLSACYVRCELPGPELRSPQVRLFLLLPGLAQSQMQQKGASQINLLLPGLQPNCEVEVPQCISTPPQLFHPLVTVSDVLFQIAWSLAKMRFSGTKELEFRVGSAKIRLFSSGSKLVCRSHHCRR